jgi:hypothetical protein
MVFKDESHQQFYNENMAATKSGNDPYRQALFYTLGLTDETRRHISDLFDFEEKIILVDGVLKPWQTGTTRRVTRLAFNLYNNYHGNSEDGDEASHYTPEDIFANSLMAYFMEAIKLRHPNYYHQID